MKIKDSLSIFIDFISDAYMFWWIQILIAGLILFLIFIEYYYQNREGIDAKIIRGEKSMNIFYGTYASINGILIALCLSVNVIESHRIIWVLLDTFASIYICLINRWMRNKLIGFADYLSKRE